MKHGPPYLKLSADKKASVRQAFSERSAQLQQFIDIQAAYYDALPVNAEEPLRPLSWVLASLRALSLVHQTHHWQTRGGSYYADHLLFQRLYEDGTGLIDQVAERAVGLGSSALVDLTRQINNIHRIITMAMSAFGESASSPEQMVQRSLVGEMLFLKFLGQMISKLEASGALTPGLSNLLEGVADKHEEFTYLLSQRSKTASVYTYDRG